MTTIRPLKIEVNEKDLSVWVSAGVMLWDLMDYLANYVTPAAPRGKSFSTSQHLGTLCLGYALHAHPVHVNQTVAGTIATGSHGSSITYRTLSSHVLAVKAVLANGTSVLVFEESHPFLIKAFRVNVGRLGVVTEVKIRIFKEKLVRRSLWSAVPLDEVIIRLKQAQEMYKLTGALPEWLDGTELIWMTMNSTVCSIHIVLRTVYRFQIA